MSVDQCRLTAPGFLHAISLGYMHSMLSLDRAVYDGRARRSHCVLAVTGWWAALPQLASSPVLASGSMMIQSMPASESSDATALHPSQPR